MARMRIQHLDIFGDRPPLEGKGYPLRVYYYHHEKYTLARTIRVDRKPRTGATIVMDHRKSFVIHEIEPNGHEGNIDLAWLLPIQGEDDSIADYVKRGWVQSYRHS